MQQAIVETSDLNLEQVRYRRQAILHPINTGAHPEATDFTDPLARLIVRADVYLERWELADRKAAKRAADEERLANPNLCDRFCYAFCYKPCLRYCEGRGTAVEDLPKPTGTQRVHNQEVAITKKRMMGRPTVADVEIAEFYLSEAQKGKDITYSATEDTL